MPATLMIPGIWFDFGGGQRLLVPPLSLGALELLQDQLDALPTLSALDRKAVATIVDAAWYALRRNYPDMTRDQVAGLLDVANMGDVYECVMDVTGAKRRAAEADAGNLPAVGSPAGPTSSP